MRRKKVLHLYAEKGKECTWISQIIHLQKHDSAKKTIDKAIDDCGIPLEEFKNTESCVRDVMRRIGASLSEYEFVKSRVALRVKAAEVLDRTDAFVSRTEKMLDQFEQDEREWERKGNALGFDF